MIDAPTIKQETMMYRSSADRLSEFVDVCLDITGEHHDVVKFTDVHKAYQAWAEEAGEEHPISRQSLLSALSSRKGMRHDVKNKQAALRGVKLLTVQEQRARVAAMERAERPLAVVPTPAGARREGTAGA